MTECLIIQIILPDRVALPHRPDLLARSDPASRAKGANRQRLGLILTQTLCWNFETTVFNLHNNASVAGTVQTGSTLSP